MDSQIFLQQNGFTQEQKRIVTGDMRCVGKPSTSPEKKRTGNALLRPGWGAVLLYRKSPLEKTESSSAVTFHWLSYRRLPLVELFWGKEESFFPSC